MQTSRTHHIKRARKNYTCAWCWWQPIKAGSPYKSYVCFDTMRTVKMHPECYEAMQKADLETDGGMLPVPGTYRRGCWCEEKICTCGSRLRRLKYLGYDAKKPEWCVGDLIGLKREEDMK